MANYQKSPPKGSLEKPRFTPPVYRREMKSYYPCNRDGFFSAIFGCESKTRSCASYCTCDRVCTDSECPADCKPDCRCDSYCSDCSDNDCGWDCPNDYNF